MYFAPDISWQSLLLTISIYHYLLYCKKARQITPFPAGRISVFAVVCDIDSKNSIIVDKNSFFGQLCRLKQGLDCDRDCVTSWTISGPIPPKAVPKSAKVLQHDTSAPPHSIRGNCCDMSVDILGYCILIRP